MMRRRLLAGNWKMHKTRTDALVFARLMTGLMQEAKDAKAFFPEMLICAPNTALPGLQEELAPAGVALGAQNMHEADHGAFTGEVSVGMLEEVGCSYVILGHSERRMYFAETDTAVAKKTLVALAQGLSPIVCVGESLEEREQGLTASRITAQVGAVTSALADSATGMEQLVVAYEPIWAIGTGKTASAKDAQEVAALIRRLLSEGLGEELSLKVRILYGGSVKPDNIADFLAEPDIDGALVGGASLEADSFYMLAKNSAR